MKNKIVCIVLLFIFIVFNISCSAETVVPILMYHNINDSYNIENSNIEISNDKFEEHLDYIKKNGYTTITLDDYLLFSQGEKSLPDKPIIITFDDGYLNNYTNAFPMLKERNMKATIFVITGRMGMQGGVTYPHFTWEQAKEMEDSGLIDIQSHTYFHNDLSAVSEETVSMELRKSRFMIYKYLNKKSDFLAFPYGNFNENVKELAKKAGYKACVEIKTGIPGVNRVYSDVFALKRITAFGTMSGDDLIYTIKQNIEVK